MSKPFQSAVVLFESEKKVVDITSGLLTQMVHRRVIWKKGGDGAMHIVVELTHTDDDELITTLICQHGKAATDPIVGYRVCQILCALPVMCDISVTEATVVALWSMSKRAMGAEIDSAQPSEDDDCVPVVLTQVIGAQIGNDVLQNMCLSIPRELESMVKELRETSTQFTTATMHVEVEQGLLPVTPFLKTIGVDRREVLLARSERLGKEAEQLLPLFRDYLATDGRHGAGCNHETFLLKCAVECFARGITDVGEVVTACIVRMAESIDATQGSLLAAVNEYFEPRGMQAEFLGMEDFDPEATLCKVAGWVAERTQNKASVLADEVRRIQANWSKMPITAE
jgi:hypothetical protein